VAKNDDPKDAVTALPTLAASVAFHATETVNALASPEDPAGLDAADLALMVHATALPATTVPPHVTVDLDATILDALLVTRSATVAPVLIVASVAAPAFDGLVETVNSVLLVMTVTVSSMLFTMIMSPTATCVKKALPSEPATVVESVAVVSVPPTFIVAYVALLASVLKVHADAS